MAKETVIKVKHFSSQGCISVMSDWINRFLGIKSDLCVSQYSPHFLVLLV